MEIKKIVTREMEQNCYLILNGNKGILIDPGIDTFSILKETENVEIQCVLLTHCHYDHIFSVNELGKKMAATKICSENMQKENMVLSSAACTKKACDIILEDGEEFNFSGILVKCIHTPGHTSGGACYMLGKNLFSGDTLFYKNVGRCDLPSGNFDELEKSIKEKLYSLPDETVVYPGHGRETTIGFEKKNNFYVKL